MEKAAVVAATVASPKPQVREPELPVTINGFPASHSLAFKISSGCWKQRRVQYPIHPGTTLTLPTPHIIQEHKGDEFPAKVPPPQDATVSKEGALHLAHRGFIVLVCLCGGRSRLPFGLGCPHTPSRRRSDAIARHFGRHTI